MKRCDLLAEDCVADHLCPRLDGHPRPNRRGWVAPCPACGGVDKLSITIGSRQRIIWDCHRGCSAITVKRAMVAAGVAAGCIPWTPPGQPTQQAATPEPTDSERLAGLIAFLDELISVSRPGTEMRIGQQIYGDDLEIAERLKIPERTAYRYRKRPK